MPRCFQNEVWDTVKILVLFAANTAEKMKFFIADFFTKCNHISEEIRNGKLHFLCSVRRTPVLHHTCVFQKET